ncbi:hypothetical protein [Methylomonas sp. HYX-M1]|uniref:hypothetical protein n=1 Tax=Methylomonas sp. HYX-M1 TaxID=3139307 RepID=UPI00345B590D
MPPTGSLAKKLHRPLPALPAALPTPSGTRHAKPSICNVSLNEIDALIKSGVDGLLDVEPYIPTALTHQSAAQEIGDISYLCPHCPFSPCTNRNSLSSLHY